MSAYSSYHHHHHHHQQQQREPPFLLDSVYYQNSSSNSSGVVVDAPCFSQFYPPPSDEHEHPLHISPPPAPLDDERRSSLLLLEQQQQQQLLLCSKQSDNDESPLSTTNKKQSADSSSLVLQQQQQQHMDRLESGEQVTQMLTVSFFDKKKKNSNNNNNNSSSSNRDASSLTGPSISLQSSKDARDGDVKKQKKWNEEKKHSKSKADDKKDHNKKCSEEDAPKGYIHVRARRGQATDSHSLAERVRREKISERMKLLQSLVPGCDKVTGKALMLDEIINYVQSLQNQVEFLSMKLASVNPMFYNFGMDLDAFMIRPEQCSSTQPTAFADTQPAFTTPNNYPLLDTSSALLLQQGQQQRPPTAFIQDSGNLLWDVDDQRQKLYSESGFNTNLCSFH